MTRTILLFLLLASPSWAQDYAPELPPVPAPELSLRALGYLVVEPEPVADVGDPVTIDLLCARFVGATDQCEAGRARLQSTANNSLQGHVTFRLVRSAFQSNYQSNGVTNTDLTRVYLPTDGFADDIVAERNRLGADCVVVLTTARDACGVAYMTSFATSCIAVVADNCITNSSYEHEVGHTIGMAHDQPNSTSAGYKSTSYGHCAGCGDKDVMVYPSPCAGTRRARYSNPDQFCPIHLTTRFGAATANGALALRERAPVMAAFRTAMAPPKPAGKPVLTED